MASRLPRINTMCWFKLYDAPPDKYGTTLAELDKWPSHVSGDARKPAWWSFARVPAGSRPPAVGEEKAVCGIVGASCTGVERIRRHQALP